MAAPLDAIDRAIIAEGVNYRAIETWVAARAAADKNIIGNIKLTDVTVKSGRGTLKDQDNLENVPPSLSKWQIMHSNTNNFSCLIHSLLTALSPTFRKCTGSQKDYLADYYRFHLLSRLLLAGRGIGNIGAGAREMAIRDCMTPGKTLSDEIIGSFANIYNISIKVYEGMFWSGFKRDINAWILIFNPNGIHYESVRRNTDGAYITSASDELALFDTEQEALFSRRSEEELARERAAAASTEATAGRVREGNDPAVRARYNVIPSGIGYVEKLLPIVNQGLTLPPARGFDGCAHCLVNGIRILQKRNINQDGYLKNRVSEVSVSENSGLQKAAEENSLRAELEKMDISDEKLKRHGISLNDIKPLFNAGRSLFEILPETIFLNYTLESAAAGSGASSKAGRSLPKVVGSWCPSLPAGVKPEDLADLCAKIEVAINAIKGGVSQPIVKNEDIKTIINTNFSGNKSQEWLKNTIDSIKEHIEEDEDAKGPVTIERFIGLIAPSFKLEGKKKVLYESFLMHEYDILNKTNLDIFDIALLLIILYKCKSHLDKIHTLSSGKGGARRTRKRQQKKKRSITRNRHA
jgi:hypothetical protein